MSVYGQDFCLEALFERADVARTTFYKYFDSKEQFIADVISSVVKRIRESIEYTGCSPSTRIVKSHLLGIFELSKRLGLTVDVLGYMIIGIGLNGGQSSNVLRDTAIENRRLLTLTYQNIAEKAGFSDPSEFAAKFGLLVEGFMASGFTPDKDAKARVAKQMARALIDEELARSNNAPSVDMTRA